MIPGPLYVYTCPTCNMLIKNNSLTSGNTFGARFFSDGKRIAPMLPEYPYLSKCQTCTTIFWLNAENQLGFFDWGEDVHSDWENAPFAHFLEISDYFHALSEGIAKTKEQEIFIRTRIIWAYNDRTREHKPRFNDDFDGLYWYENCKKLITLIDSSDTDNLLFISEIHRYLGEYSRAIKILKGLNNIKYQKIADILLNACTIRNTEVLELT